MALNILITIVIGSALGFIVVHVAKVPVHLRGLVLGCCAAGQYPLCNASSFYFNLRETVGYSCSFYIPASIV